MSDLIHTFQSQLSGVMETVFKAAIFEITRLVEESFLKEVCQSQEQVETLKKRLQWTESRWRNQETRGSRCTKCLKGQRSKEEGEKTLPSGNHGGLKQENVPEDTRGSCELDAGKLFGKERSEDQTSFNNTAESVGSRDRKLECILKEEAVYIPTDNEELQDGWTFETEAETSDFSARNYSEQQLQQIQEDWSCGLSPAADSENYARIADIQGLPYRPHYNTDELVNYNKLEIGDLNGLGERTEGSLSNVVLVEPISSDPNMTLEGEKHHNTSWNKSKRINRGSLSAQVNPDTQDTDKDMHCLLINEKGHLQDMSDVTEIHSATAGDSVHKSYSIYVGVAADDINSGLYEEGTLCHSLEHIDGQDPKSFPLSHQISSDGTYTCNQCGKKFTQVCNLKVHQRVHQRDGHHLCSHCGKGYSSFSDLRRHKCSQTGDKPYTCTLCGNRFSRLWNLKLHRRIHTQEKPHHCTVCNKSFTRADLLKVHQRTHTGERPYCCCICGLSFKRLHHLRSHQRKHSAEINNQ